MTLTPSMRAISLCNFPCVTNSFACVSFVAISALECFFFLAIGASLRSSHYCRKSYCASLQRNTLFPCRFRKVDCQKSRRLQPLPRRKINMRCRGGGTECETCVCGMLMAKGRHDL